MSARGLVAAGGVVAWVVAPAAATAQNAEAQISARASATQVEAGEPFTIELRVGSDASGASGASDPELRLSPPFSALAQPMIGQSVMQSGGRITREIVVTWQVAAQRPGRFSIPGPSVIWNGKRIATKPIAMEVVAATGRPRPRPGAGSFMDPFGSLFGGSPFLRGSGLPFSFGEDPQEDDAVGGREASTLNLPSAPDPRVFLRAVADKKSAVIGEQVMFSFYLYYRSNLQRREAHDAPFSDFRHLSTLTNPGAEPDLKAKAGRDWYQVKLLEKVAAFPLRTGELSSGKRWERFVMSGVAGLQERETEDVVVSVVEPPREGRPPGYRVGDVGQFALSAVVEPRRIQQGGEVSVTIKASGSGNFPDSLRVPERSGVEWLDPEKKESIGPQGDAIAGYRTFGYVVRVKESGEVDLGTVTLSYWNPAAKHYEVARAELGTLAVTPVAPALDPVTQQPSADPAAVTPFAAIGGPRMALTGFVAPRAPFWGEGSALWLLVAAPPLFVGLAFAGGAAATRLRARRAAGQASLSTLAAQALDDADAAEAKGDRKAFAAAVERAVHLSVEAATGFKSRGALREDLPAELEAYGVPRELGDEIQATLAACESIRFEPVLGGLGGNGGDGGGAFADAGKLGARARALGQNLMQIREP